MMMIVAAAVVPRALSEISDDPFVYLFKCADWGPKSIAAEHIPDNKGSFSGNWYCWGNDWRSRDFYRKLDTKAKYWTWEDNSACNAWYWEECNCVKASSQVTYDCDSVENPISADDVAEEDPMGNYVDYYCFKTACQRDRYCLATKTCEIRGSINNDMWCVMKQEKVLSKGRSFSDRKDDGIKDEYDDQGYSFDRDGLPICPSWFG